MKNILKVSARATLVILVTACGAKQDDKPAPATAPPPPVDTDSTAQPAPGQKISTKVEKKYHTQCSLNQTWEIKTEKGTQKIEVSRTTDVIATITKASEESSKYDRTASGEGDLIKKTSLEDGTTNQKETKYTVTEKSSAEKHNLGDNLFSESKAVNTVRTAKEGFDFGLDRSGTNITTKADHTLSDSVFYKNGNLTQQYLSRKDGNFQNPDPGIYEEIIVRSDKVRTTSRKLTAPTVDPDNKNKTKTSEQEDCEITDITPAPPQKPLETPEMQKTQDGAQPQTSAQAEPPAATEPSVTPKASPDSDDGSGYRGHGIDHEDY